ncbi:multidrug effflux MFS transporter [Pseudomonas helleri]|jgi:MFS transporter, DHA1 family, multidrug resistance protein|uniref:Bcr/CflA family efflux transporter n=1 Tax=Pseudomonas helleri TaxID=1608996 RepID=A0A6A7Z4I6_9PSED|nr:multidrug effflux MFS transporter [Pseudomonas helleri]KMN22204.1 multidrug transporter CflA [Pseudomonas helleri]MQT35553.1 Bcr/CflA family efflux MFS transporter [Pseudomonas helleri]MQT74885.1 Bcr/CflA family efflux MFS transporter [Pseudomonas helleri]MQT96391.1 Bcr/CflA family efflux MFS transporter [Pseudomonas helleri]MQU21492.1 Bcr/CflA family efflux MFS transporter [Pseudomonas helleri]
MSQSNVTRAASQARHSPANQRLTAGVLFLLAALAALGALATNIILPAFPAMGEDLGVSVRELSATLTSFFMAFALGQLFVGPLSDRFGRQRLVLIGLVIFIIGCLVCAVAGTLPQLIVGRVIQALGVCATSVLSRAIARDLFDGQELTRALSLTMVAMAAAPGFSPLLGGAFNSWLGWRATFGLVGVLAILLAMYYIIRLGETHSADKRPALSASSVLKIYQQLLIDRRFMAPALSVSLVIGSLYAFFATAPAILMTGFHFSPFELGLFFASTVFVVFGAGFLGPRCAQRWGQVRVARVGIIIALAASVALLVGKEDVFFFSTFLTLFLLGMGLVNPLGTAIALQPFGQQAGAASALLGFLQMGCAAMAISVAATLPVSAYTSLGIILTSSLTLSFFAFLAMR